MPNVIYHRKFLSSTAGHRERRRQLLEAQAKQNHFNKLCKIAKRLDDPEIYKIAVNYRDTHIWGKDMLLTPLENALREVASIISDRYDGGPDAA